MKAPARPRVVCQEGTSRRLNVEFLEERRLLAGTPWHNAALPLDVNTSGKTTVQDAIIVINGLLNGGTRALPDLGGAPPQYYYDVNGDNMLSPADALRVINRLSAPPVVTLSTLAPTSIDVTPQVTVTAAGAPLPNGTPIDVDVDVNGNGNFNDSGEAGYAKGTLWNGKAIFDISPGLPVNEQTGLNPVRLQARVASTDGVEGTSSPQVLLIDTRMSDALENYINNGDGSYSWSLSSTVNGPGSAYKVYNIDMISQTWRTAADVNKPVWRHWVQVIVPAGQIVNTGLLLIDGGNNTFNNPPTPPTAPDALIQLALLAHSVVIDLKTVPSEPLLFTEDPNNPRSEDEIIAYSFDQYMEHLGEPGNESWPVLQAMAKSAVRAMDTVQAFVPNVAAGGAHINDFVVTGYSKRGWTTWLTAAVDDRVKAIIPGVIDVLNQGPQMAHHYGAYGFFSPAIQDYNDLQIFDRILSAEGMELSRIVDPYRYLNNGRFNIPKLLINSAGDQFFVSDSAQFYIHDLPGTANYLRYLPNTNHKLDNRAVESTASFYDAILNNRALPKFSWAVQPDGSIKMQTTTVPTQVLLWQITNPNARDFRKDFIPASMVWTSSPLTDQGNGVYIGSTPMPATGATAFLIEMTYPSAIPGDPYVFTTEIHVNTNLPLFDWPFEEATNAGVVLSGSPFASASSLSFAAAVVDPTLGALAPALALQGAGTPPASSAAAIAVSPSKPDEEDDAATSVALLLADDSSADDASGLDQEDPDADLVDSVFGESDLELAV